MGFRIPDGICLKATSVDHEGEALRSDSAARATASSAESKATGASSSPLDLRFAGDLWPTAQSFVRGATSGRDPEWALFRDAVIANHFDPAIAAQRTIGIEVELMGLEGDGLAALLVEHFGGTIRHGMHGDDVAIFLDGTALGDVRLEPVSLTRVLNKHEREHPNSPANLPIVREAVKRVDSTWGQVEIVTPPMDYAQLLRFAEFLDVLGPQGGLGTSNLGRLISTQVNIGIDPTDAVFLKDLLANYYRNADPIRRDV
ncbi:MAG: amidoligase family protein, partial [Myxococcota bacterium]